MRVARIVGIQPPTVASSPPAVCRWATRTTRAWYDNVCNCNVVECRNPACLANPTGCCFVGVRYPTDESGAAIENPDYLEIRSRYCNANNCNYFESQP